MEPASAEKLLKAFHILDTEGKGTLSKEYICKLMSEEGEPFTQASPIITTYNWCYFSHVFVVGIPINVESN